METRVGSTIAGYRLDGVLGRGGMSVVYLAEQLRLGRKVALKLLSSGLAEDASFRERFEREARQAAEIDHANIVPVYDAGEAEDHLYIAMRYVEGEDLGSLIAREGPLGVGRTLFLLEQAAAALDAAHARELVHRDVKPANLLIEAASERVFVSDFGIAKRASAPGLTRTGFFLGTVDYAAPEQIEGGEIDGRTDVYALGCVLYECLCGRPPFERENEVAVMHAHLSEQPPKLTSARLELPEALDRVVATALAKQKDERYGTCGELVAAARAAALGNERSTSAAGRPPSRRAALPGRLGGKRVLLAAALGAVAAAGVSAGVAAVLSGDHATQPGPTTTPTSTVAATGLPLADYVPKGLVAVCVAAPIYDGASATATCRPPKGSESFFPARVQIAVFTPDSLDDAYTLESRAHGFEAYSRVGACDERHWQGEGPWEHGPSSPGGHRFCYRDGDDAVLWWSHEEAGEPDHSSILGFARAPAADRDKLLEWWSLWRHSIGRVTY